MSVLTDDPRARHWSHNVEHDFSREESLSRFALYAPEERAKRLDGMLEVVQTMLAEGSPKLRAASDARSEYIVHRNMHSQLLKIGR